MSGMFRVSWCDFVDRTFSISEAIHELNHEITRTTIAAYRFCAELSLCLI
jgi:hypothetical protein